jgi:hypothetical protein
MPKIERNNRKGENMEEEKRRRGRPVTPYKVGVMVRITPEAAEILKRQPNQSEFIDELIKQSGK